eukprot:gene12765-14742_t
MVSKATDRLYDAVVAYFGAEGSFTQFICPAKSMDRPSLVEIGNELSIDYIIPASVCRKLGDGRQQFAISAILALLDEFSTSSLMMKDKSHRPGVSVTLDLDIIKPCYAGEKVRLVGICDKIGKSIAFISMEIRSTNGELLARGKHIKFVKMGWIWDLLTSVLLFPLMLVLLEYFLSSKKNKRASSSEASTVESQVGHIFDVLKLENVQDPSALFLADANDDGAGKKKKSKRKVVPVFAEGESCCSLRVNRSLSNVLGAMHGGAIAAAAEEASRRHLSQSNKKSGNTAFVIDSMSVTYLSPTKGELVIAVKDDAASLARGEKAVEGRVLSRKTGQVCAAFKCSWK